MTAVINFMHLCPYPPLNQAAFGAAGAYHYLHHCRFHATAHRLELQGLA